MRLQEIRHMLDIFKPYNVDYCISNDDVTYLLERLSRYETALKEIVNSIQYWDGPTCAYYAEKALKENTTL